MVITVSREGYVKRTEVDTYRAQRRGGRGLQGMGTKEEDWVEHLFVASAHEYLMIFTRSGQCHWLKVWQIPPAGRHSRGKPIVNLLNIDPADEIASVVAVREFSDDRYLLFCTKGGKIKKTALSAYGNVRAVGLIGIKIREGDELIDVQVTGGDNNVILATRNGLAIRFRESDARVMGRVAEGVRGIRLGEGDRVVGMVVVARDEATLLVVSESGMGKALRDRRLPAPGTWRKGRDQPEDHREDGKGCRDQVGGARGPTHGDHTQRRHQSSAHRRDPRDRASDAGRSPREPRREGQRHGRGSRDSGRFGGRCRQEPDAPENGEGPDAVGSDTLGADAEAPDGEGADGEGADAVGPEGEGEDAGEADAGEDVDASLESGTGDAVGMDSDTEGE